MILPYPKPETPYQEGMNAASLPPNEQPDNSPYPEGSQRDKEWWNGYGDWTDDRITDSTA